MEGTISLIQKAQSGDDDAITRLISIVKTHHMPRYVGRYRGRNVLIGDDEIESEFLFGFWRAIEGARLDVGNPLNYLLWKGQKSVASLFRSRIRKEVRFQCMDCSASGTMKWREKVPVCKKCESRNLWTWMTVLQDDDDIAGEGGYSGSVGIDAETAWQLAVYGIQIEEFRARLQGRALELFDIIVLEGINRDSSKNYLQEIAERWGVSSVAVAAALRRLRTELLAYIKD